LAIHERRVRSITIKKEAYANLSSVDHRQRFWRPVTGPNTGIGHTSALFIIESQMN
jgi:hypothetical protein